MRLGNKENSKPLQAESKPTSPAPVDVYFSADVETDGPIPGPFSMLSFALVHAGRFDGSLFEHPTRFEQTFYRELKPISENFQSEALRVNGLDRERFCREGENAEEDQATRRGRFAAANAFGDAMFERVELLGHKSRLHRLLVV